VVVFANRASAQLQGNQLDKSEFILRYHPGSETGWLSMVELFGFWL
jgi:hypothetical protein